MKKRFLPLSMLLITIVLAQASIVANATGTEGNYKPRTDSKATFSSFMKSIRANQETGLIDPALLIEAQKAASSASTSRELTWTNAGPDNFGGFTRGLVFDKNGNVVIGTSGGDVYKTTNGGITFKKINTISIEPISCMAINSNGDIFIGTGDGRGAGELNGMSAYGEDGFIGNGVYKMAAGSTTIEHIASTNGWSYVNELNICNNKIYAATDGGLYLSENNGESWSMVLEGAFLSVKTNDAGDVLAADGQNVYLNSTAVEAVAEDTDPKIIATSPSNPNYMYIALSDGTVYFTSNRGSSWEVALTAGGPYTLFGGDYPNEAVMIVYPDNPKKLLIGSADLIVLEDKTGSGANSYRPIIISTPSYEYVQGGLNPYYLHCGIQSIAFAPNNSATFFVGTEGGIFKGDYRQETYTFKGCNRYFITEAEHCSSARIMNVGIGGTSKILGGCLDHGTIKIDCDEDFNGIMTGNAIFPNQDPMSDAYQTYGYFTKEYAAGPCAISTIAPKIMFVTTTGELSTPIYRTETDGVDYDATKFYGGGDDPIVTNANAFRTPFAIHENYNDANNPIDTLRLTIRNTHNAGDVCNYYSLQGGYPIAYTLPEPPHDDAHFDPNTGNYVWIPEDEISGLHDPLSALLVCGVEGKLYMTRDALIFNKDTDWLLISTITGIPSVVTLSSDGNMALVGTFDGNLYKVSGLNNAYTAGQASVDSTACVLTFETLSPVSDQAITSISIDPVNNNNIVLTLGNYGNDDYVFRSTDGGNTFTSIQGTLGKFPVYSSVIEKYDNEKDLIILGTEYGIYVSEDNGESWQKSGNVSCPVMDLKQAVMENHEDVIDVLYDEMGVPTYVVYPGISNEGMIYAATYGEGIITCANYKQTTSEFDVDEIEAVDNNIQINVYPNPVKGNAQFTFNLSENANVSYQIYDLSGRMVANNNIGFYSRGEHSVTFSADDLMTGSYIIRVQAGDKLNTAKFLVY